MKNMTVNKPTCGKLICYRCHKYVKLTMVLVEMQVYSHPSWDGQTHTHRHTTVLQVASGSTY